MTTLPENRQDVVTKVLLHIPSSLVVRVETHMNRLQGYDSSGKTIYSPSPSYVIKLLELPSACDIGAEATERALGISPFLAGIKFETVKVGAIWGIIWDLEQRLHMLQIIPWWRRLFKIGEYWG